MSNCGHNSGQREVMGAWVRWVFEKSGCGVFARLGPRLRLGSRLVGKEKGETGGGAEAEAEWDGETECGWWEGS